MNYKNIKEAVFISRPNRFVANILLDGQSVVCHVKNTGRCKELLVEGARVFVEKSDNENRKTAYDLVAVYKQADNGALYNDARLINMDANAPNAVFGEWLKDGGLGFVPSFIKAEYSHGDSRFDFYFEGQGKKYLAEIKGVTLEQNGVVRFPDAPTLRGVKHINGLISAVKEGYEAYIVFVVQMNGVKYFEPNRATHKGFADALIKAKAAGVNLIALDCEVAPNMLKIDKNIEIRL